MKGWLQTWLVHMRDPIRLWRDLGPGGFAALQILFASLIGSALAHPLSILFVSITALTASRPAQPIEWLVVFDLTALVCGYCVYWLLLRRSLGVDERHRIWPLIFSVPFYWLLQSIALLRAIGQLFHAPHYWEKTPHELRVGTTRKPEDVPAAPSLTAPERTAESSCPHR